MKKTITKLTMLLMAVTMSMGLMAQTATPPSNYATSNGSSGDPYFISSLDNLYWLTQTSGDWDKYFLQTTDIDATTTSDWDGGAGFSPIGNSTSNFTGSYNGGGYTIGNLFINRSSNYQGLFGYIYGDASTTEIQGLGLTNVDITGNDYTGGLAGYIKYYSTISNCYCTGSVSGALYVGGLIGQCFNYTTINNCYSTGSVKGTWCIGGLIGYHRTYGSINNSYSHSDVTRSSGTITSFGGFCGNIHYSTVENCYSTGDVFSSSGTPWNVGGNKDKGFVGELGTGYTFNDNFFDSEASNQTYDNADHLTIITATAKTTAEMKDGATYTATATDGLTTAWDFVGTPNDDAGTASIWGINPNENGAYPVLVWQGYDNYYYTDGSGTSEDEYEISTMNNLQYLSGNSPDWDKYFIQIADIDASSTSTLNGGAGFSPIGNNTTSFTGSYDGDEKTITNLTINRNTTDYIGLFGKLVSATLTDIGIVSGNVSGQNRVGILCGTSQHTTISGSYTSGQLTSTQNSGFSQCGGLLGYAWNCVIERCYSTASVSGDGERVAGLAGVVWYEYDGSYPTPDKMEVKNCYATGNAEGTYGGGLIGYIGITSNPGSNKCIVENCYSTGNFTRTTGTSGRCGGFVGYAYSNNTSYKALVQNCYSTGRVIYSGYDDPTTKGFLGLTSPTPVNYNNFFDSQTSQQTSGTCATEKTPTEMKDVATFTSTATVGLTTAWDFTGNPFDDSGTDDIWSIDGSNNSGYPWLTWEGYDPVNITWDGSASTDWNATANWSLDAVPTVSNNPIINSGGNQPTISATGTASCNNLTVNSGATLTINSTSSGTGSLIVEGTATGDVTVERFLTQDKWHYISAPVNDTRVFNTFLGLTGGANNDQFYWWDEDGIDNGSTGIWFDILNTPTGISYTVNSFLQSQGYAITYAGSGSETINFIGVPFTESKTITITKTDASTNTGANLVGNPFTSSIAINDNARDGDGDDANNYFIYQNASLLSLDYQAIYLWDESQSDYVPKNNGIGAVFIAPGQGFMVVGKNASSSLAFNKNTRKHGAAPFYKKW